MSTKYLDPNVLNVSNKCEVNNMEVDGSFNVAALDISGTWNEHLTLSTYQQLVSPATSVTTSGEYFIIDTSNITIPAKGAGATDISFSVVNSAVAAGDHVLSDIFFYSGTYATNGVPTVIIDSVTNGSFLTRVINNSPATAVAGTTKIYYRLLHQPAP